MLKKADSYFRESKKIINNNEIQSLINQILANSSNLQNLKNLSNIVFLNSIKYQFSDNIKTTFEILQIHIYYKIREYDLFLDIWRKVNYKNISNIKFNEIRELYRSYCDVIHRDSEIIEKMAILQQKTQKGGEFFQKFFRFDSPDGLPPGFSLSE